MAKRNISVINLAADQSRFAALDQYAEDGKTLYIPNNKLQSNEDSLYEDLKFVYETLAALTLGAGSDYIPFDDKGCETFAFKFQNGQLRRGFTPSLYQSVNEEGVSSVVIRWGNQVFPLLENDGWDTNHIVTNARSGDAVQFSETVTLGCWTEKAAGLTFIVDDETAIQMWFRINLQWGEPETAGGKPTPPTVTIGELEDDYFASYAESFATQLSVYKPGGGGGKAKSLTELPEGEEIKLVAATATTTQYGESWKFTAELENGEVHQVWANAALKDKMKAGLQVSETSPVIIMLTMATTRAGKPTARVRFITQTWDNKSNVIKLQNQFNREREE